MVDILIFLVTVFLFLIVFICLSFFISCVWEKERRASVFAFFQFMLSTLLFVFYLILLSTGFFKTIQGLFVLIAFYILVILASYLLFRKDKPNPAALLGTNGLIKGDVRRFDERETLFSRSGSIKPGTERYEQFYKKHPGYKNFDDKRRAMGGPMGHAGSIDGSAGDVNVAMMMACSSLPETLRDSSCVKPSPHPALINRLEKGKIGLTPEEATERIKGFSKTLGADLVGVAVINPSWVYSHSGRIFSFDSDLWGKEITLEHKYAVVFAEEMSIEMVQTAPHTPTSIESMHNYSKGAFISVQVAAFIANLGYSATANHFRYYEALMVPLAIDAGLGELNRMGYLITKKFGPRVRLSAVTTDLPLIPDKPVDIGAEDFCTFCKKCAFCCPSQSIPSGDSIEINGTKRWKLEAETCYEYWGKIGTDCNRCMMVCPWSHARTFPHKLIVCMITRNSFSRRIFSIMDDIFYGRRPKPKEGPRWARYK